MKVLDPQSALLTNAEVHQFLQSNPARKADKQIGAYQTTNLVGYTAIRKDFDRYTAEITPHVMNYPPVEDWIGDLIKQFKPYELTKTEVMNLINMGIGARVSQQQNEEQVKGDAEGEEEPDQPDEEAEISRDVQFFKVVVEEADDRFPGDDGEETIRKIVSIMKETITGGAKDEEGIEVEVKENGVHDENG